MKRGKQISTPLINGLRRASNSVTLWQGRTLTFLRIEILKETIENSHIEFSIKKKINNLIENEKKN